MTEHDLREDFRQVSSALSGLAREVSSMGATIKSIDDRGREHSKQIQEIREMELTCPARAKESVSRDTGRGKRPNLETIPVPTSLVLKILPYLILAAAAGISYAFASTGTPKDTEKIEAIEKAVRAIQGDISKIKTTDGE